jgi:hypothetical protein
VTTIGLNTNSNYGWGWDPSQDEWDRYLFRSVLGPLVVGTIRPLVALTR